jgi:hypothetical protein
VLAMLLDIAVHEIAPRLAKFRWTVEHCRKPISFTSDRPVMYWRPAACDIGMRVLEWRLRRRSACR